MLRKKRNKLLAATIATLMFTGLTTPFVGLSRETKVYAAVDGDGTDEINEAYARKLNLQPVAPAFRYDTMMAFDPEKDPDAKYNRSTVPLAKRFKGVKINPLASDKARITSCAIMTWNHDQAGSNGGDDFNVYAFDNWQLLDSLIFWSGTDEGIFALPAPDVVDAAHRNGVPVYATVGFPWGGGHSDSIQELRKMCTEEFAEKMADIAIYYGFDGYFFNQETYGCSADDSVKLANMLKHFKRYAKSKGHDLKISWYDSMANNGQVNYQNAVTPRNDIWVKPDDDGVFAVDEFFMNYNWGRYQVDTTVDTMEGLGRDPFDAYAGLEVQQRGYKTNLPNLVTLLDDKQQARLSIALYAPNGTMGSASSPAEFHKEEEMFYTGPQGDPSQANDSATWKGMARFVADKSAIMGDTFISKFVAGHGKNFYQNGKKVKNGEWHNRAIQNIMPTWRWWIRDQKGSRIQASYDFDDVWYGGNSLKFYGDLEAGSENKIMLYSTNLEVKDNTRLKVTFKAAQGAELAVAISTDEDYRTSELKEFKLNATGDWQTEEISLADLNGQKVHALAFVVRNTDKLENYKVNLGELAFISANKEEENSVINKVSNLKIEEKLFDYSDLAQARITWDKVDELSTYNLYQVNKDGEKEFLGQSLNNIYHIRRLTRTKENANENNTTKIVVVPVNKFGVEGEENSVDFVWPMNLNDTASMIGRVDSENIAMGAKVTGSSASNDAEPADKALDGTAKGNSKWCATGASRGWMTIDLGSSKTIQRVRVEHAQMGGEAQNMNTVRFNIQYKDTDGTWKIAKEIDNSQQDPVSDFKMDPITAQEWKLEILDSGRSPWGAIRIYEWQMYESAELPKTSPLPLNAVTAKVNEDENTPGSLEFSWVEEGSTVRIYKDQLDSAVIAEGAVAKSGPFTIANLNYYQFLNSENRQNKLYYTIQTPGSQESDRQVVFFAIKGEGTYTIKFVDEENKAVELSSYSYKIIDPVSGKVELEEEYTEKEHKYATGTYVFEVEKTQPGFSLQNSKQVGQIEVGKNTELTFVLKENEEHKKLRELIAKAKAVLSSDEASIDESIKEDLAAKISKAEKELNSDEQTDISLQVAYNELEESLDKVQKIVSENELITVSIDLYRKLIKADEATEEKEADSNLENNSEDKAEDQAENNVEEADQGNPVDELGSAVEPDEEEKLSPNEDSIANDESDEAGVDNRDDVNTKPEAAVENNEAVNAEAEDKLSKDEVNSRENKILLRSIRSVEDPEEADVNSEDNGNIGEDANSAVGANSAEDGNNEVDANSENAEAGVAVLADEGKEIEGYEYVATINVSGKKGELIRTKLMEAIEANQDLSEKLADFKLAIERNELGESFENTNFVFDKGLEKQKFIFLFNPKDDTEPGVEEPTKDESSETTSTSETQPTETETVTETEKETETETTINNTDPSTVEVSASVEELRAVLASLISRGNAYVPMQNDYPMDIFNKFHNTLQAATILYNSGSEDKVELKESIDRLSADIEALLAYEQANSTETSTSTLDKDKPVIIKGPQAGQVNQEKKDKLAATGEEINLAIYLLLTLTSVSILILRKKLNSKEE